MRRSTATGNVTAHVLVGTIGGSRAGVGLGPQSIADPATGSAAGQRCAVTGDGYQGGEVDTGRDTHAVKHPNHVLVSHAAGGTGGERAAGSAERGIEHAHAPAIGGIHVRQTEPIGIVRI